MTSFWHTPVDLLQICSFCFPLSLTSETSAIFGFALDPSQKFDLLSTVFFCLFVHQHYGILSCLGLIWFLVIRRGNSEQECPVMSDPSQNSFSCWTLQSVHKNIWERASQQQLPRNVLHFTPTVTMNHLFSHHMPWEFCLLNPHSHAFTYSINEHKNSLKPNIVFLHALKSSRSQKMWLN